MNENNADLFPPQLIEKIRGRASYKRYRELSDKIKIRLDKGEPEKILEDVHDLVEQFRGYHYEWQSCKAHESILLIIKEARNGT